MRKILVGCLVLFSSACLWWEIASDGFILVSQTTNKDEAIVTVNAQSLNEIRGEFGPNVGGETLYHGVPSIIDLPVDAKEDGWLLGRLARHEFGHAFGNVQHLPPGNVMAPIVDQGPKNITCDDLHGMCKHWGVFECRAENMPPCQK